MSCQIFLFLKKKWSIPIILKLNEYGIIQISELKRFFPTASEKMLIETLDLLLTQKIVHKKKYDTYPKHTEYTLTSYGKAVSNMLIEIKKIHFKFLIVKESNE